MNERQFVMRIAHILTHEFYSDLEMLNAIRASYQEMVWPEKELSEYGKQLIRQIYADKQVRDENIKIKPE